MKKLTDIQTSNMIRRAAQPPGQRRAQTEKVRCFWALGVRSVSSFLFPRFSFLVSLFVFFTGAKIEKEMLKHVGGKISGPDSGANRDNKKFYDFEKVLSSPLIFAPLTKDDEEQPTSKIWHNIQARGAGFLSSLNRILSLLAELSMLKKAA